jgi:hypothetical protein
LLCKSQIGNSNLLQAPLPNGVLHFLFNCPSFSVPLLGEMATNTRKSEPQSFSNRKKGGHLTNGQKLLVNFFSIF